MPNTLTVRQADSSARTNDEKSDQSLRDAFKVGLLDHHFIQSYLTWQSSVPYSGQVLRRRSRLEHLATTTLGLGAGIASSHWAIASGNFLLLLLGWIFILYGLRKLRLTILHAASHKDLTSYPWLDNFLGQVIATLVWNEPFKLYRVKHTIHHQWTHLLTAGEDSFEALKEYGFKPGVDAKSNWRHLNLLLLNPLFYVRRCFQSWRAMLCSPFISANLLSLIIWLAVFGIIILSGNLMEFTLIWLVPRTLFYEMSFLLRLLVEHRFPLVDINSKRTLTEYRGMTKAIFCAEPIPVLLSGASGSERFRAWFGWLLRMLCKHLPSRLLVLTGDSPCHDLHHLRPGADWANGETERQKFMMANPDVLCGANWGIQAAIQDLFESLEKQPKDLFL